MTDQPQEQQPESSNSVTNVSGGVNANAERINVGADVVGRDKTISAGTYIEHYYAGGDPAVTSHFESSASTLIKESPKPLPNKRVPDKRIIVGVLLAGAILVAVVALILIFRPAPLILTNSNWNDYVQDSVGSSLSLQAVPGTEHSLVINFDLKPSGWVGVYKRLSLPPFRSIRVLYKGTGASNTIELKLIDKNGTIFDAIQAHTTNTNGQSQSWEPRHDEFHCRKGSGICQDDDAVKSLALKPGDVDRVDISFSNKSGHADKAGPGQVIIEEIQIIP